ncbi:RNA-directed DNA polymerase from mobile element jockey [Elysia marginata]|uniref:RNA-directed DNA polymerase from mobile element jockey n=1 Tax=Elysia marginata TaxID=1093978 RepID=A0AAV4I5V2_9GAST|nr:RNA-directed DNA polymerase from mobile element jockey [Elysia marginata]
MRHIEDYPGIKWGGHNINNLRYADGTVLIAENESDSQKLLDVVYSESQKKGLELNSKKTEVMVISRKANSLPVNVTVNKNKLTQRENFKYLGTLISSDGRSDTEIQARMAQAKATFQKMKSILTNPYVSIQTRKRVLERYIEPILMYGSETWTITNKFKKKLEAVEMWFLRRMLKIPWTAKKTNERVLQEPQSKRSLLDKIRKRQATFFGHIMRQEKLENLVITGMMMSRRCRGKQRERLTDGMAKWLVMGSVVAMLQKTKMCQEWRRLIANAMEQGT